MAEKRSCYNCRKLIFGSQCTDPVVESKPGSCYGPTHERWAAVTESEQLPLNKEVIVKIGVTGAQFEALRKLENRPAIEKSWHIGPGLVLIDEEVYKCLKTIKMGT